MTAVTAKRTIKEIAKASLRLYKNGLIKVLPLCALYFLILFAMQLTQQLTANNPAVSHTVYMILRIGFPLINMIMQAVIFAAVIYTLHQFAQSQGTDYKSSLAYCFRRFHHLILGYVLFVLSMAIGTVLFIIPGLIVFVLFTFFYMFVLLENQSGLRCLASSAKLVWPYWGRTALLLLISIIIFILLGLATAFIISMITYVIAHFIGYLPLHINPVQLAHNFTIVTTTLVPTLLLPLPAAFMLEQYYDLNIRQLERLTSNT